MLGAILGSVVTGMFNKKSADDNRDFQEEMSSTAHQREVQDLIAAGLNPMLSAKLGGASSPGGSTATMPDLGAVINNATMADSTSAKQKAEIDLVKENTAVAKTQAQLNQTTAAKQEAEALLAMTNASAAQFQLDKLMYQKENYDPWDIEMQILYDNASIKSVDKLKADNDWSTIIYLNKIAEDMGYGTWEQAVKHRSFKNDLTTYVRNELAVPKESALADFYKTPFGREVAPYLSSASDAIGIAGSSLSVGRRLLGKPANPVQNFLKGGRNVKK